jgi:hypothetical protein
VIGDDHRGILHDFYLTEPYHRADISHLTGDVFTIGAVTEPDPPYDGPGEGWWILYNWDTNNVPYFGSLGTGVQSVRVADGCYTSGTRWTWYAWERNGGVYINRVNQNGSWGGAATFISGARNPVVSRGTDNSGTNKVVLLYELPSGGRSYLYYRFLACGGTVGTAYAIRSVGDPWYIWHIEAAFNTNLDHWRIFWDERNDSTGYTDMRTKYLQWNGYHSTSTFLVNCAAGGLSSSEERETLNEVYAAVDVLAPSECEYDDYPPEYGAGVGDGGLRYPAEGCKRFFVSFDPSAANVSHRYLLSYYNDRTFLFIAEDGTIAEQIGYAGNFSIPLTGVCNVSLCSYQEIGKCVVGPDSSSLSHRRFTYNYDPCAGGDDPQCDDPTFEEYPVTPLVPHPYPLAIAASEDASVVLYFENLPPYGDSWGDLFATVIDN